MFVDGESLADMLIEAGMAVRYDNGKKTHKWCLGGNKWERKKEAAARMYDLFSQQVKGG